MPSLKDLPESARRRFVADLHVHYRAVGRPSLRVMSTWIAEAELPGMASAETIRKMLLGLTVPTDWRTVEALLLVLCTAAGTDPDGVHGEMIDGWGDGPTYRSYLKNAWNDAYDEDPFPPEPPRPRRFDPDEPPF